MSFHFQPLIFPGEKTTFLYYFNFSVLSAPLYVIVSLRREFYGEIFK